MKLLDPIRYVNLKASGRLPSPKGLALAIIKLLQEDGYKVEELVRLIQSDPAIAGEVLKFSNAVLFGESHPIVSLSQAVIRLGASQVRAIVIAFSILNNHRSGHCAQFDYEKFWSHSLATAISARALASYVKINADENFTVGLLCSLGELAMASIYPVRYGEIISISSDGKEKRIALEREAFGIDHRELNATILLEWGLPKLLVSAIYYCNTPDETEFQEDSRIYGLTLSLNVALTIADICVADEEVREAILVDLYIKAEKLGINTEEINSMADEVIASWQEWGRFLKIKTKGLTSFADILVSATPKDKSDPNGTVSMTASIDDNEPVITLENDLERKVKLIEILNAKKKQAMSRLAEIERDWKPITTNNLFEFPSDYPLICMVNIHTKERGFFDTKLERLLTDQETFDFINGSYWNSRK